MSDDSYSSINLFNQEYDIKNSRGLNIAKVMVAKNNTEYSFGTVFTIHGYGGSALESCLYDVADSGLKSGFDIVAIETNCMSAISNDKSVSDMTLQNHKKAIFKSLVFCSNNLDLNYSNNIVFAHSMGGRALADLALRNKKIKNFFKSYYFLNPYFFTPSRIIKIQKSNSWESLKDRTQIETREIMGAKYPVVKNLKNYVVDPEPQFAPADASSMDIAARASSFWDDRQVNFILGTNDLPTYGNYLKNIETFDALKIPNKQIYTIPECDHFFENKFEDYHNLIINILSNQIQNNIKSI